MPTNEPNPYMDKLVEFNWNPSKRQLRHFGILCLFLAPLLGWLWKGGQSVFVYLIAIGLLVAVLSFVWPTVVKAIFLGLMMIAAPVGIVVSEFAMLLIFLGVFLPISLIFKLLGRDALRLKADKTTTTYWHAKRQPDKASSYYRQY